MHSILLSANIVKTADTKSQQEGTRKFPPDTKMDSTFFALLFRQRYIRRWGLMRNSYDENLSEHCTETALLAHALATIGNEIYGKSYNADSAATLALFHDAAEIFTGDFPTPVKYFNENMRKNYEEIEANALDSLLSKLPDELRDAYSVILKSEKDTELHRLVKAADKLCAYIKCVEEVKNGNSDFKDAMNATYAALQKYDCPELRYFNENFLPAFGLTIDEL